MVMGLDGGNGSKRPARSTHALVLNWVESSGLSPVDINNGVDFRQDGHLSFLVQVSVVSEHFAHLEFCHGREGVVTKSEGVARVVIDHIDLSICLFEKVQSELVLLCCVEGKSVFAGVEHKSLFGLGQGLHCFEEVAFGIVAEKIAGEQGAT